MPKTSDGKVVPARSALVNLEVVETDEKNVYDVWMLEFGHVECRICAKNLNEAKRKLGEYVYNELEGRELE